MLPMLCAISLGCVFDDDAAGEHPVAAIAPVDAIR